MSEQFMGDQFRKAEEEFLARRKGRPYGAAWMQSYSRVIGAAIAWGCEIGLNVAREKEVKVADRVPRKDEGLGPVQTEDAQGEL